MRGSWAKLKSNTIPLRDLEMVAKTQEGKSMSQNHQTFKSWDLQGGTFYQSDCADLIPTLARDSIRLIAIDPPFFTGKKRVGKGENPATYSDHQWGRKQNYLDWLMARIALMRDIMLPDGSILVHLDWRAVHEVKVEMDRLFGVDNFRNEIIWHFQTGGKPPKNCFNRKHHTILWYTKGESWYFDPNQIKIPRTEKSMDRARNRKGARFDPDDNLKSPHDVVTVPALNSQSNERTKYPDEKPIALMELFIKAVAESGSLVADFFVGSGTTAAAAARLERRWIACDESPKAIEATRLKFKKMVGERSI